MGLNLHSKITLDSASFEHGMHRVKESVAEAVKSFAVAAIGVGTIDFAIEKTAETAKALVNSAKRLGATVEQVQVLKEAAKDAGKEFDTVAGAIEKINIARAKALGGDKKALAAFLGLGVSRQDLLTKTGAQLFTGAISDTVKTTSPEQIAAPLKEVLGRGAGEAVAILKTDFAELGKEMAATGAIMSSDVATKLKVLGDEFDLISQIITAQLAPALLALAEWAYKIILKTTGKVAGAGAFWGAVEAGMEAAPDEKNNPNRTSSGRINFWKELFDQVFGGKNKGAVGAAVGGEKPFDLKIEEFEKSLEKAAQDMKSPKPDFSKTEQIAKTMAEHREKLPKDSDALIKVGNFLGSSRGVIANAQGMLVQHAAHTEQNTKICADTLKRVLIELPQAFERSLASSLSLGTQWPSN